MEVLGLDIGGTNARIALIEIKNNNPEIIKKKSVLVKDIKDVSNFINSFNHKVETACIGFAGPIVENSAKLTNADLKINLNKIKKNTNLKDVRLVNDFHASGHGVDFIKKSEMFTINEGKKFDNTVRLITGPGTGLGKVYFIRDHVYPCEPGWTTPGIQGIDEYSLVDYLKHKYDRHIFYEDLISGKALIDIYDHIEIKSDLETNMKIRSLIKDEPVHKAKVLIKYSSKYKLCDMTLRSFTKFYARYVRDSCLSLLTSKVYLVGGISSAIKPYLKKFFMKEFLNHPVYSNLLKRVNIILITNEDIGLIGAGAIAAKLN